MQVLQYECHERLTKFLRNYDFFKSAMRSVAPREPTISIRLPIMNHVMPRRR